MDKIVLTKNLILKLLLNEALKKKIWFAKFESRIKELIELMDELCAYEIVYEPEDYFENIGFSFFDSLEVDGLDEVFYVTCSDSKCIFTDSVLLMSNPLLDFITYEMGITIMAAGNEGEMTVIIKKDFSSEGIMKMLVLLAYLSLRCFDG